MGCAMLSAPPFCCGFVCSQGLTNFDGILKESDGIILGRGDLGIDLAPEKVPRPALSSYRAIQHRPQGTRYKVQGKRGYRVQGKRWYRVQGTRYKVQGTR